MRISLIFAKSSNGVIGKENTLPWHLSADLKRFKKITSGNSILMGRKTYESIGRPLPNRKNVVITRQKDFEAKGCVVANSLEEAIEGCKDEAEIFVIGGSEIYKQAMKFADRIHLTEIHEDFEGDAFAPEFDLKDWQETSREDFEPNEKNKYSYSFIILDKN
ncbi:MAG: dihydrofolate reductase [Calditrichaeota bacterium]|nr:MAG: dihydrofolate reductase [Calditrichota bacterium]